MAVISEFPDRGIAGLVQAGHPALRNWKVKNSKIRITVKNLYLFIIKI